MKMANITIKTFDDVEPALLELGKSEASIAKTEAAMNEKLQNIRGKFELDTAADRANKELIAQRLEAFAVANKAEFAKERSRMFIHGSIGFRTNPPKVTLLNKKYNLKTAIELLKKIFPGSYVREKEEINKEAILTDYAGKTIDDSKLAAVGLKVDQDETFTYDIKWDSIN